MNASTKARRCRRSRAARDQRAGARRPTPRCAPRGRPPGRRLRAEAHHVGEEGAGLVGSEPQVGGTQLDELAARPQPGQRQRRVRPCRDRQAGLRRQVVQEERHHLVHLGRLDDVVVVERQHGPAGLEVELVDHTGQHRLGCVPAQPPAQPPRRTHPRSGARPRGARGSVAGRCRPCRATATRRGPGRPRRVRGPGPARSSCRSLPAPRPAPGGAGPPRRAAPSSRAVSRGLSTRSRRSVGTCTLVPRTAMRRA